MIKIEKSTDASDFTFGIIDDALKRKITDDFTKNFSFEYEDEIARTKKIKQEMIKIEKSTDASDLKRKIKQSTTDDFTKNCSFEYEDEIARTKKIKQEIKIEKSTDVSDFTFNLIHDDDDDVIALKRKIKQEIKTEQPLDENPGEFSFEYEIATMKKIKEDENKTENLMDVSIFHFDFDDGITTLKEEKIKQEIQSEPLDENPKDVMKEGKKSFYMPTSCVKPFYKVGR